MSDIKNKHTTITPGKKFEGLLDAVQELADRNYDSLNFHLLKIISNAIGFVPNKASRKQNDRPTNRKKRGAGG